MRPLWLALAAALIASSGSRCGEITVRNPFSPPEIVIKKPQEATASNPLQKYDVKSFVLKGVVTTKSENLALVLSPDGNVYIVRQGMHMGNKGEVIEKIYLDRMVLVRGNKKIVLKLREKEGP